MLTTEDDFQRKLDQNPDDHHTRLVFADWLDDRGDERAAGYRALGVNGKRPNEQKPGDWTWHGTSTVSRPAIMLPNDWLALASGMSEERARQGAWPLISDPLPRRGVEDAAARAFLRLPEHRRQELLAVPVTA